MQRHQRLEAEWEFWIKSTEQSESAFAKKTSEHPRAQSGLTEAQHCHEMAVSWISALGINIQSRALHMAYETPLHVD